MIFKPLDSADEKTVEITDWEKEHDRLTILIKELDMSRLFKYSACIIGLFEPEGRGDTMDEALQNYCRGVQGRVLFHSVETKPAIVAPKNLVHTKYCEEILKQQDNDSEKKEPIVVEESSGNKAEAKQEYFVEKVLSGFNYSISIGCPDEDDEMMINIMNEHKATCVLTLDEAKELADFITMHVINAKNKSNS